MLILAGVSLSFVFNGGILDKSQQAVNEYENASQKEQDLLDKIDKYLENELGENIITENKNEPNPPELMDGMTGVYWDSNGDEITVTEDNKDNWYNYSEKKWANAKTKDGSYWVWIPRFEYSTDGEYFDVNFIPVSQTTVDDGYTHIHPAFRDGSSTNYMNGEWDKEIAKAQSFYGLNQSITDSHMTKNSEWGAIIYLANSQYGRDGTQIEVNGKNLNNLNNLNIYAVTGYSGDTPNGLGASSTGNATGIFDLYGGVFEKIPAYISDGSNSISLYAQSFAVSTKNSEGYKTLSTKYATVYPFNEISSVDSPDNFNVYQELITDIYGFGDGMLEYKNYDKKYMCSNWVFFIRGLPYNYFEYPNNQREFAVNITAGVSEVNQGFRVILIKK